MTAATSPSVEELALVRRALDLGAASYGGALSTAENALARAATRATGPTSGATLGNDRQQLQAGLDPLGEAFCRLRSPELRRADGAVYTPKALIGPMIEWSLAQEPDRVVDAGAGSGRFALQIIQRAPQLDVVAVDADPLATLMTRAGLATLQGRRGRVVHADYTTLPALRQSGERTAFIGNPPYVRHHALAPSAKRWAQSTAKALGHRISGLAGLHAYFFLATAAIGRPGDVGCFVTSAEWLDVNYGAIVRDLLMGPLGGEALHVVEPDAAPFPGTATTAAISCFRIDSRPTVMRLRPVKALDDLGDLGTAGEPVARERLSEARRWSTFVRTRQAIPEGHVELGELCRVHRGAVTGANKTWVTRFGDVDLPESVLVPTITRARELFDAGHELAHVTGLKRVINLPADLDQFDPSDRGRIERFLRGAKRAGVPNGYIASQRRAWWAVGLRDPAPILATYMARRPPAFVRNSASARHINIAHGLYPREPLADSALRALARALSSSISVSQGRTYAGGLTKFEPKEMERLLVPAPDLLNAS